MLFAAVWLHVQLTTSCALAGATRMFTAWVAQSLWRERRLRKRTPPLVSFGPTAIADRRRGATCHPPDRPLRQGTAVGCGHSGRRSGRAEQLGDMLDSSTSPSGKKRRPDDSINFTWKKTSSEETLAARTTGRGAMRSHAQEFVQRVLRRRISTESAVGRVCARS